MIKRLLACLGLILLLAAPLQQSSFAYSPFSQVDCSGDASSSSVCTDKGSGNTNPLTGNCQSDGTNCGLLGKVTNLLAYVAGAAAIIVLITGAIRYILSGGSEDKVASAKRSIVGALIGLAIIVLAKVIITFAISKLT